MSAGTVPTGSRSAPRWLFVSDVHLGTVDGSRDTGRALAQFLEDLAGTAGPASRLVLLGDVFEMLESSGRGEAGALARLDAIVASNEAVFSALRRCIEQGVVVEVVAGNHDMDLVRPAVERRLRGHLGVGPTDDRLRIWPWLYVVPGVLYAEHGNQHHDLNRFPRILDPYSRRRLGEMHTPPLAAAHPPAGGQAAGWTRRRLAFLSAALATWRGELAAADPAYWATVSSYAVSIGLPGALVATLERRSRLRPIVAARRLTAVLRRRVLGRPSDLPDAYMVEAAADVHRICARWGSAFPVYVFGHTHVAADLGLDDGAARYLNCGTWSPYFRRDDPAAGEPTAFPFVEVVADGAGVRGSLRWWRCRTLRVAPVDDPASCARPKPTGPSARSRPLLPAIRS